MYIKIRFIIVKVLWVVKLAIRLKKKRIANLTIFRWISNKDNKKSGHLAVSGFYDVAGISCLDLRQIITLLLVPLLLEQLQLPSSSYDE
jgi:hypothetical protein